MAQKSNPVLARALQKYQYKAPGYTNNYNFSGNFPPASSVDNAPGYSVPPLATRRVLTYDDVITKAAICLGLIVFCAAADFMLYASNPGLAALLGVVGAIVSFVAVIVDGFKRAPSKALSLTYAIAEGLFIGFFTQIFAQICQNSQGSLNKFPWVALQAFMGTVGVFATMLFLYKQKTVRATPRFNKIVFSLLIGSCITVTGSWILSLFTGNNVLYDGGLISIIVCVFFIGLAAACLVTDFDNAERLVSIGADEQESWRIALGLSVTVVWIYTEILRLLSYISRDS